MKLYIFDCVEIVHDRAMAICVIALNRDVSRFLFCRLLNRPAFLVRVLSDVINNVPFFCYALAY